MQKTENIDLKIKLSGLKHCGGLDLLIEEFLHVLQARLPISSARVVLEQQRDTTPAYRVFAHLAVPGPDIHGAARDHTLLAAWRKLAANLKAQFQRRTTRQQLRLKRRENCRAVSSQWNRGA